MNDLDNKWYLNTWISFFILVFLLSLKSLVIFESVEILLLLKSVDWLLVNLGLLLDLSWLLLFNLENECSLLLFKNSLILNYVIEYYLLFPLKSKIDLKAELLLLLTEDTDVSLDALEGLNDFNSFKSSIKNADLSVGVVT